VLGGILSRLAADVCACFIAKILNEDGYLVVLFEWDMNRLCLFKRCFNITASMQIFSVLFCKEYSGLFFNE